MIEREALIRFIEPYYENKDIMHNLWHIELVYKQCKKIIELGQYKVNTEFLNLALCFHGFIYKEEKKIRQFLQDNHYTLADIDKIMTIAWESQRPEVPVTLEGKVLHDAHILEGGKTYTVVKTLITGSVRGQSLCETLDFMKNHVLNQNKCYLPEAIELCREMNDFTTQFYKDLVKGIE